MVAFNLTLNFRTQEYRWLSSTAIQMEMKDFADRHFEHIYGVIRIVSIFFYKIDY